MDLYTLLQIIIGFFGLIIIALPLSDNYKIINYKYVLYGILSQILLAAILLKVPLVISAFEILGNGVVILQEQQLRELILFSVIPHPMIRIHIDLY